MPFLENKRKKPLYFYGSLKKKNPKTPPLGSQLLEQKYK
jgi:hypothetical protein